MNPYEMLGVKEDATIEEISEIFRRLAKKYHPDSAKSEEERRIKESEFILITQAYNTIKQNHIHMHRDLNAKKKSADYISITINKAKKFINLKDYNSAISILKGLDGRNRDDVNILLGEAYFRKGRYHEALRYFKLVYDNKPWDIGVKLKIAGVYEKIGLKNTAKKLYQEVLSLDSSNEKAINKLSKLNKKNFFSFSDFFKKG